MDSAVDFDEDNAVSGHTLHNKAFAAKEGGTELFLEEYRLLHIPIRSKEAGLLYHKIFAALQFHRENGPRKTRRHCNIAFIAGNVLVHKHRFTGKHTSEHLPDSAVRSCLHFQSIRTSGHCSALTKQFFALFKIADNYRKWFVFYQNKGRIPRLTYWIRRG